ncbi:ECF transporter S component [Lachnospiraceae bacterium ZAX-1]
MNKSNLSGNIGHTSNKRISVSDCCISAVFAALVFIATLFINVRLPISMNGGLIHLGNVPLFIAAIVFGKKQGALAGAIGMGLFDILGGWIIWAPFTVVIRGVMGYIIGAISEKRAGKNVLLNTLAIVVAGIWMIAGYYTAEVILYHNFVTPFTSMPGDVIQVIVGAILGIPISAILIKTNACKVWH